MIRVILHPIKRRPQAKLRTPKGKMAPRMLTDDNDKARGFRGASPETVEQESLLFSNDQDVDHAFDMKDVPSPLEIATMDEKGTVQEVGEAEPETGKFEPSKPFRHALEAPKGTCAKHGIEPGAKVDLPDPSTVDSKGTIRPIREQEGGCECLANYADSLPGYNEILSMDCSQLMEKAGEIKSTLNATSCNDSEIVEDIQGTKNLFESSITGNNCEGKLPDVPPKCDGSGGATQDEPEEEGQDRRRGNVSPVDEACNCIAEYNSQLPIEKLVAGFNCGNLRLLLGQLQTTAQSTKCRNRQVMAKLNRNIARVRQSMRDQGCEEISGEGGSAVCRDIDPARAVDELLPR